MEEPDLKDAYSTERAYNEASPKVVTSWKTQGALNFQKLFEQGYLEPLQIDGELVPIYIKRR